MDYKSLAKKFVLSVSLSFLPLVPVLIAWAIHHSIFSSGKNDNKYLHYLLIVSLALPYIYFLQLDN